MMPDPRPSRKEINAYWQQRNESPDAVKQRLMRLYDLAIRAAEAGRRDDLEYCLAILRKGLNPEACPELAFSLAALYEDIEEFAKKGNFEAAATQLEVLRGLWEARARIDAATVRRSE